ncbi:hypothetical protein CPB97_006914 [Podila verticillata]|nr:hypothetical protein CPB97_006914 [Podila verticillata]
MQSVPHNPSTPSYLSTPVNYLQHSSPVGYMPPSPSRWIPNVVEQQGSFRYVKTNTPAPPQKPRPSSRGGSPGFLYPTAPRLHGLPPKPAVASSSSAKTPKKKATPVQPTNTLTNSTRIKSDNKVLRKTGGEAIIRAFVHVMSRGYIYMSKELIARLYRQQFISDKLEGLVPDWNILDCKLMNELVEVTPIQGVRYYRLNEPFFRSLEPAGFAICPLPAPPSTPFTSEQLATLPAVHPFSDQVIRTLCGMYASKVSNFAFRFPSLIPSKTGGVLNDMATFIELWHPSLGSKTGPTALLDKQGKGVVSRFDMTDEKFDQLMAESLQRGSTGKQANKILKNFSSSILKPLEEQRQAAFLGSSYSDSQALSSNPGSSNTYRSVHMKTEPEDISQLPLASQSSEPSAESESESTSTEVSNSPLVSTSFKRRTAEEIEARKMAKKAAKKAKKIKQKLKNKPETLKVELDTAETQLAQEAFEEWAATQEPFIPKPRIPAKHATQPSSIIREATIKKSIVKEAVEKSIVKEAVEKSIVKEAIEKSIVGNSTIDVLMEPIAELAGTLDDKYPEDDFLESVGPSPDAGSSRASSVRDEPLEDLSGSKSIATKKLSSLEKVKSTRFSPYANADQGPTRKPRLIMPASLTRQQGNVDSSMTGTSANEMDDGELAALAQIPMDRMSRDQLIKARKAALDKILNFLWNLSR